MSFFSPRDPLLPQAAECSIFERALDALPDGVLLVSARREIVYANLSFVRLWGMPGEILASGDDARILDYVLDQLVDPAGFRREVERLHASIEVSEDEIRFKDGRIFSRRSVPFEDGGTFNARIWIFTDITEARSATVDHLTELRNRKAFAREFPAFAADADSGRLKAVAIMDVDNFKRYNDLYGHAAGDEVLRAIGLIIRRHLHRADDLVFRVGGEEFLMAFLTDKASAALALFDSVRRSIAAMGTEHLGNPPYNAVTASLGVGLVTGPQQPDLLFGRIDSAMYRAKAAGRNTIVTLDAG